MCTSCGRSLLGDAEPEAGPGAFGINLDTASAGNGDHVRVAATTVAPPRPAAPPPGAWVTPSMRAAGRPPTASDRVAHRALPTERRPSERLDPALLLAALVAIGAAVIAWQMATTPWVTLSITDTSGALDPVLVGRLTLPGTAALVGTIDQVLAAALGIQGLLWLFYGWDRGATMPWFASPGVAIVVTIAAIAGVLLASGLWFVWEDAAIEHARAIRLSAAELRDLLDLQPAPLVKIQRLDGLVRFGGLMAAGFLAAATAWWAYRRRG